jgi:predicted RNase H-like nuclease
MLWKDDRLEARVFARFVDLLNAPPKAEVIAVDIPIGLTEVGARACDEHARSELGQPRGSSVFPAPLRAVFAALWTARRILTKKSRAIPSTSASDANGLPMRIAV